MPEIAAVTSRKGRIGLVSNAKCSNPELSVARCIGDAMMVLNFG